MAGDEATKQANAVLNRLNAALAPDDAATLESCFYADQAYWKDQLALTYHLRTFKTPGVIAASFLETKALRRIPNGIEVDGAAVFLPATPVLVSNGGFRLGAEFMAREHVANEWNRVAIH